MRKLPLLYILLILLLPASCIRDEIDFDLFSEKITLKPTIISPLAFGSLTMGKLLKPQDSVVRILPGAILEIPIPEPVSRQFPVGPVRLNPFGTASSISLDDLVAPGRINDPEGSTIRGSVGSSIIFPSVPEQQIGSYPAGALEDMEFARFTQGEIEMKVKNNLPVEVSMDIRLVNDIDGTQVGLFSFASIGLQQTVSRTRSLSGVIVRNNMSLEITRFSSPGSGSNEVPINLDDKLEIEILSKNLLADKGNARVPLTLIDAGTDMPGMNFPADQRIDVLNLERGKIHFETENNIRGLWLKVELLNVTRTGNPYFFLVGIDGSEITEGNRYFSDVDLDLASYDNRLMVNYTLMTGSGGAMTDFDISGGTLGFNMHFSDFDIGYASGYFGKARMLMDTVDFDLDLHKLTGEFRFTNPSIRLFYENNIGVPMNLKFNLIAESSDGSEQVRLFEQDHEGFTVEYPEDPSGNVSGEIIINSENSEIVDLINILPSKIIFIEGGAMKNPQGDTGTPNFITSQSRIKAGMEIMLPIELQMLEMGLTDTIEIDFNPKEIDFIDLLIMDLEVTNGFPLGVALDLDLYDSVQNVVLHTFDDIVLMKAAPVDANGVVTGSTAISKESVEITGETIDHLVQASHIILTGRFDTGEYDSQVVPVKIESTNTLDFRIKIKAELNYSN